MSKMLLKITRSLPPYSRVETLTQMSGASQDVARLTITTTADVHVLSPCEFSLTLTNTDLRHSDVTGNMKTVERSDLVVLVYCIKIMHTFHEK